jgi:hypothetical protein
MNYLANFKDKLRLVIIKSQISQILISTVEAQPYDKVTLYPLFYMTLKMICEALYRQ